jgi:hypothetical protein
VEYLEDVIKIWSQTTAEKLSKFGEKDALELDETETDCAEIYRGGTAGV